MRKILSGLFNQPHLKADGLVQSQREAIIDLLHFCMSADENLTLVEDKFVTAQATHFDWEPRLSFEDFALESLNRGRAAMKTPERRAAYLQDIARRLNATDLKTHAVALCQRAFQIDGDFAASERAVFSEIKAALGWPDRKG